MDLKDIGCFSVSGTATALELSLGADKDSTAGMGCTFLALYNNKPRKELKKPRVTSKKDSVSILSSNPAGFKGV